MKLTKYEHACFTVEIDGKILIVDPGGFTKSLGIPENVVAVVVTHEHADHFSPDILTAIFEKNPDCVLLSLSSVVDKMPGLKSEVVQNNTHKTVGPFELDFFGEKHAVIYRTIPLIGNIGVLVNHKLYYPGDSFTEPTVPVEVLALPVSAPWLKISEAIDYLLAVKPMKTFPTHVGLNSEAGQQIVDRLGHDLSQHANIEYIPLTTGNSLEI
jgi:L-ascorbate metabolism protein UlaG (beta-lactamase superfamily)